MESSAASGETICVAHVVKVTLSGIEVGLVSAVVRVAPGVDNATPLVRRGTSVALLRHPAKYNRTIISLMFNLPPGLRSELWLHSERVDFCYGWAARVTAGGFHTPVRMSAFGQ
jgi:hypothetical protein